ncbi:hypothetical protein HPB51_003501 [Rhipicephalus microplus]|uniref:Secreted protein n=1 Tax=Rhipicephalus microplus TaxID=6941 RepID=A0A9J6EKS2_RHIMP|nr:hypothetical protein HPB51_003501 [Rhipicephalus microplus]
MNTLACILIFWAPDGSSAASKILSLFLRKSETVYLEMPSSLLTSACYRPLFTNLIMAASFSIVNRWYCFPRFDAIGEDDEGRVGAIAGKRNPHDVNKGVC